MEKEISIRPLSGGLATEIFQAAIDAVSAAGGGVIVVHPGSYTIGMVSLKSNVHLRLLPGSVIAASTERDHYSDIVFYGQTKNPYTGHALFFARDASNIAIYGDGEIHGNDRSFWNPRKPEDLSDAAPHFTPKDWRPNAIAFENCQKIRVQGISITNSSVYALWLIDCKRVAVRDVNVEHDFHGPNTDGFHISSCQNVTISGCFFHCGDDCIAVDGDGRNVARNITISDCVFESLTNAVRLYVGLDPWVAEHEFGEVTQVTIANSTIRNAAGGINIVSKMGRISMVMVTNVSSIQRLPGTCVFLQTMNGEIEDVSISGLIAEGNGVCSMMADRPGSISRVSLRDSSFSLHFPEKPWSLGFPETLTDYTCYHHAPWTLHFRRVHGLTLDQIAVRFVDRPEECPPLLHLEATQDVYEHRVTSSLG